MLFPGQTAVIMGPTASGKTALALRLATDFNAEIISADSMQVYNGLDIGAAKPTAQEQQNIPHHLLNLYDLNRKTDVYDFIRLAENALNDIHSRGRLAIIAGGTGFYIKSLLYGLDQLPGDAGLRARLDAEYDHPGGYEKLKIRMRHEDPADFERWKQHRRKLIRALEVFLLTGKSITELQTLSRAELRFPVISWNLVWERDALKRRIAERTQAMLTAGWIEETRTVIAAGILNTPTAHQALGYSIIGKYLRGDLDYDGMREEIITKTWQLARRQTNWFRHQHPETENISMPRDYESLRIKFGHSLKTAHNIKPRN
ncbi:MAG: tRNA (adenosine(37)-N6)-dimethylallyltransferase MiaA [Victivallales bacterium]|nr:tRNA (adenosine(37)-N6)-dimethylallyltransferase MiaA [Victivallales bacterium]